VARTNFSDVADRLGLSDDEALEIFDVDALSAISGELDHRPELPILGELLAQADERVGSPVLRRWVRAAGRHGRPIELLMRRDFAGFEDALQDLIDNGLILRSSA
jgi:hypothetical protein